MQKNGNYLYSIVIAIEKILKIFFRSYILSTIDFVIHF